MKNLILASDSYKTSHFKAYPKDTARVSSYVEARGGEDESVFFGLQAFIREYLLTPITMQDINEAEKIILAHNGTFNREGWEIIVNEHGGYIPVEIKAVKEGTVMPTRNVQVQVVNTDSRLPWVTSYIETAMLRGIWYPSTVATKSRKIKGIIASALEQTSDNPVEDQIGFKLHDFGARGATTGDAAAIGGLAHLVNFLGTDTLEALGAGIRYYDAEGPVGFSIPANEHSVATSFGRDNEIQSMRAMIENFGEGLYSVISDSYDIFNAVDNLIPSLVDEIKEKGGTFIVRPDSGDPLEVPVTVIEKLMNSVGYTTNQKGFKVLPDYIRVIQGDGMDEVSIEKLINILIEKKISIENIAFGMGGGLLQKWDRDTLKYAMKANARQNFEGEWFDVYKDPIHGNKKSKTGRLDLVERNGVLTTIRQEEIQDGEKSMLNLVYRDGVTYNEQTFEEVRTQANK